MGRGFLLLPFKFAPDPCKVSAARTVLNAAAAGTGDKLSDFTAFRHGQLPPFGMSHVCLLPRSMNAQRGKGVHSALPSSILIPLFIDENAKKFIDKNATKVTEPRIVAVIAY